jgi:hypothetical protein
MLLTLGVVAGIVLASGALFAHAEEQTSAAGGTEPQCVTQYYANGHAILLAETLEIPYEDVAGGPYASTTVSAAPDSHALAATEYPGFVGDVVLQSSGFWPGNPSESSADWPVAGGGRTADQQDDRPLTHTVAYAEPKKATADARAVAVGSGGGLSFAHSDAGYDGNAVTGSEVASGFDLTLGPLHIDWLRSEIHWKSDGTDAGTVGTWKLEFHGVRNGGTPVYSLSGDGWSFQGGSAQPGDEQRRQFNDQERRFSQALDQAGVAQADLQIQPGTVTVSGDLIEITGAGLVARLAPKPTRGQTDQAGSIQLGRVWQEVRTGRGPCGGAAQAPAFTQTSPPAGPRVPRFPPDRCDRDGCHPQKFPPDLPQPPGPPGR